MDKNNVKDPLLDCLKILCKLEKRSFSEKTLTAGLPLINEQLTPQLFLRAASRANFSANIVKCKLNEISSLSLPAVLILKNNNACILTNINSKNVTVILPESGMGTKTTSLKELDEQYSGYLIFAHPDYEYEARSKEFHIEPEKSWFWGTLGYFKHIYGHIMIAAFLTNLFVLIAPLFIMNVYDRVVPNQAMETLWVLTTGVLIFFVFDLIARLTRNYLLDVASRKSGDIMASRFYQQLLSLKMSSKPASSGSVSSYFNEFESLHSFFTSAAFLGLIDLPFILLFLLTIWWIGGSIVLIPIIAIPIVLIIALILENPARASIRKALLGSTQKQALLTESMNGLETIKSLNAEGLMQKRWEQSISAASDASMKSRLYSGITLNLTVWIQQIVIVSVVVFGVYLITDGSLTVGGLIAVIILSGRSLMLGQVASLLTRMERSRAAMRSLNKIMNLPNERPTDKKYIRRSQLSGDIKLDKVSLHYPGEQIAALDNISLEISAQEKVGIIGRIGSGKSSLLKLIVGLYTPTQGEILLDGIDANNIDPSDLRRSATFVSHDTVLFYGSVRENIMMANPNVSDDELLSAAKAAGVTDFVNRHPDGFDMQVGEKGESLSGGQRQAVALARAMVTDPSIVLLDEPTSAVDNQFEQELMQKLPEFIEHKTFIVVTHRRSLLELVDRIIVMDNGHIVADGPTKEILNVLTKTQSENTGESSE